MDYDKHSAAYLLGWAVALIERECEFREGFPTDIVTLCVPGTSNQAWHYWTRETLRGGARDVVDLYAELGARGCAPSNTQDGNGAYWVGYYKHKTLHEPRCSGNGRPRGGRTTRVDTHVGSEAAEILNRQQNKTDYIERAILAFDKQ